MLSHPLLRFTRCIDYCTRYVLFGQKKRLKFLDNKFMLCCIHTSNLRVHTSIFTVYEKKLVKVSVRKNFGVIMNSFSQFHSTFIRKHSRFFVRVGHKPKSIVYKVCTYMSIGNLSFFFTIIIRRISLNFLKKIFETTFCKNVPIFVGSNSALSLFKSQNVLCQPKTLTAFSAFSKVGPTAF